MKLSHFILSTVIDVSVYLVGYYALFWNELVNWKLLGAAVATFAFNRFLTGIFIDAQKQILQQEELSSTIAPLPLNEEHNIKDIISVHFSAAKPTLFLGIHGVLHRNQNETLELKGTFMEILNAVPDIQIILSSDWRSDCDETWLKNKLGSDLFSKIVGYTPVTLEHDKSLEIEMVLDYKTPSKFVILDSEKLSTTRQNGLVVRTESYKGIEQEQVDKIVQYFS